jgi:PAS domain S-box-containing protein
MSFRDASVAKQWPPVLFPGGGEMGSRMRAFDWDRSPLGPPQSWPAALQTALGILLSSRHPMFIFWGPEHRCFYNDAYARSIGPEKHAVMLGSRGFDVWPETWEIIGPQIDHVMSGRGSTWHENQLVPLIRHGRREDAYWTYGYSAIPDADAPHGVGGVLVICTETTHQVLTEQRQTFLVDLDDALRRHNDARRIVATAIEAVGRYLGASRVGFGQVQPDREHIVLETNYTDGVAPLIGTFPLDRFGAHNVLRQRHGETVVWDDVTLDPLGDAALWNSISTRALVCVPLVREGRFRASLFINDVAPRVWSGHEVALIERVASRIWDAVERAQAEAQLLLTTHRFELALQGSFVTLAHQDLALRYTWLYNRALEFHVSDAIGRTDAELFLADDAAALVALKRDAIRSRERRRKTVSIRVRGVERHFDLLVEPMLDGAGAVEGVRCAAFDITEMKKTEIALRESEERMRRAEERLATLANAMPQLVWIGRTDGTMEYVNRRLCEYTGISEAAAKLPDTWANVIHPQDRDQSMATWSEATAKGEPYSLEHRLRGHDGEYRWFLVRAQPERDPAGRIARWYGTSTDIDEAKRLEKHLVATEAALREVDMRKDLFLATLSHELRNPLAPIRNAAQILSSPALPPQRLQWAQTVIQRQVKHMAWLLDDLLDVARITQGKLELKKARVALTSIVDAAVEAARPLLDDKKHNLIVNLPSAAPILEADPLRLSQVLSNLLTNAAKYTNPGGHIELSGHVEANTVRLTVKDDGIGIPAESLERIFDMFSQVDSRSAHSDGGLGIGLSLVKGLVELHGGTTEAASAGIAKGSVFTVRLPLTAESPAGAAAERAEDEHRAVAGLKVLIADDNRDAADSLAMLLELDGHEVRVAHGGRAALALAQAFRPAVVLLDIGMPDLNGYDVASTLRREPWGSAIHLVALTGWGQDDDRRRSKDAGFDRHLTKPLDPRALSEVLSKAARTPAVRPPRTNRR